MDEHDEGPPTPEKKKRSARMSVEGDGALVVAAVREFEGLIGRPFSLHGFWDEFAPWANVQPHLAHWRGSGKSWATRYRAAEYRYSPEGLMQAEQGKRVRLLIKERFRHRGELYRLLEAAKQGSKDQVSDQLYALVPWREYTLVGLCQQLSVSREELLDAPPPPIGEVAPQAPPAEEPAEKDPLEAGSGWGDEEPVQPRLPNLSVPPPMGEAPDLAPGEAQDALPSEEFVAPHTPVDKPMLWVSGTTGEATATFGDGVTVTRGEVVELRRLRQMVAALEAIEGKGAGLDNTALRMLTAAARGNDVLEVFGVRWRP